MTIEDRIDALEKQVAALTPRAEAIASAEAELLEAARQYARIVTQGFYTDTEGGRRMRENVHPSGKATYEAHFMRAMQTAALRIIREQTA